MSCLLIIKKDGTNLNIHRLKISGLSQTKLHLRLDMQMLATSMQVIFCYRLLPGNPTDTKLSSFLSHSSTTSTWSICLPAAWPPLITTFTKRVNCLCQSSGHYRIISWTPWTRPTEIEPTTYLIQKVCFKLSLNNTQHYFNLKKISSNKNKNVMWSVTLFSFLQLH